MTTMNNEDPAKCLHPQIIAFAVADEGPDHGKPSGLWACAECGRKFEPADQMREAIAAERERDYLRWRMHETIPTYGLPELPARVLGKIAGYVQWRDRPLGMVQTRGRFGWRPRRSTGRRSR